MSVLVLSKLIFHRKRLNCIYLEYLRDNVLRWKKMSRKQQYSCGFRREY